MKLLDKTAYALGILFYLSLFAGVILLFTVLTDRTTQSKIDKEIKESAETILDTPDLTSGLEVLEVAVEQDLQDMENKYKS
jgi:hypothetical protein